MRVTLFPYFHVLGHTLPTFVIAEQLRERGAEVIFRGEGRYSRLLEHAGFTVRPAFTFSEEHNRQHELMLGQWTEDVVARSIAAEMEALEEDAPDVVVGDFRPTLGISTRSRGTPFVAINGAELTRGFAYPEALPRIRGFPRRLVDETPSASAPALIRAFFCNAGRHLRHAAERHGVALPGEGSLIDAWTGDVNLVPDAPELMPLSAGAPPCCHFIGPALRRLGGADQTLARHLDTPLPLVYVTFGSTGIARDDDATISTIVDAFAGRPVQIVMTTGGQFDVGRVLPDNFFVTDIADGLSLARRAAVTLCAGGKGTVYQSLSQGTPVVCLPRNHDQWYISRRVERVGVGVLGAAPPTVDSLRSMVADTIDDREMHERARRIGERIRDLSGHQRAAPLIEAAATRS